MTEVRGKQEWRAVLLQRRRSRSESDRDQARWANGRHLLDLVQARAQSTGDRRRPVVAGYFALPSEPLDVLLLDQLIDAGAQVLVPVTREAAALDWCDYPCDTRAGRFGLREPTGPRRGPEALAGVDLVLVPALAVDRHGVRLGRGGGHYDRSLAQLTGVTQSHAAPDTAHAAPDTDGPLPVRAAAPRPLLVAVVFDDEVVDELPGEPHDHPVDLIVSPASGVRPAVR